MVGMIQILTYLLCIYLVFKAIEIQMIAYVSTSEKRNGAVAFGTILIVLAVLIAIGFVIWVDNQATSVSDTMQRALPR